MKRNEKFFALFNQIKTKFLLSNRSLKTFRSSIDEHYFLFRAFPAKNIQKAKKKKTRDLDFSKHVTCVLQFLSSHELLIGRYVLSTFQVRLIRRIIRIFKFIFSITISIEHFLFFFFSSKYINYIRRSTIYKKIYSAIDNVSQEKKIKPIQNFFLHREHHVI